MQTKVPKEREPVMCTARPHYAKVCWQKNSRVSQVEDDVTIVAMDLQEGVEEEFRVTR